MNRILIATLVTALSLGGFTLDAQAKRLGGGNSSGIKRTAPPPSNDASKGAAQPGTPAQQQAAPAPAGTPAQAAPAAAPKRSWLGPIAGLAAGLGIAALASHFGLGGALANVMTMVLIGGALALLVAFLVRRFGRKPQPAGMAFAASPSSGLRMPPEVMPAPAAPWSGGSAAMSSAPAAAAVSPPTDNFDSAAFEQIAKRVFIRLQTANDAGDQTDLRRFTTSEMYAVVQQDLLERKGASQQTEVLQLDAKVIERAVEAGEQIVSVRFWGQLREQAGAPQDSFDEVWHLVRPLDESREWAIAGIQQTA